MLETGEVPCDRPEKVCAGNGNEHCAACGETISRTETEFEVDLRSGVTLRLHRACHDIWLEECHATLK